MGESETLTEILHRRLASDTLQLPVLHPSALKLREMLASDQASIPQISALISEDPSLSGHVLHTANSAFYSGLTKISTIEDAIKRLGSKQISNIVMLITQKSHYHAKSPLMSAYSKPLWEHAIGCALGTKWLAEHAGYNHLAQEAFLAGLLHDIGQLLILKVLEELALQGHEGLNLTKAVIADVFDSLHTTQGASLLENWGFPDQFNEVVLSHHTETEYDCGNIMLGLVRLVNLTCKKLGIGLTHEPSLVLAATVEAEALDISEFLLAELEIVIEDALSLPC